MIPSTSWLCEEKTHSIKHPSLKFIHQNMRNFIKKGLNNNCIIICLVLLFVFLAYSSALDNKVVIGDDKTLITDNIKIRELDLSSIKKIFSSLTMTTYAPLSELSYAFEYKIFGNSQFVYHLDNVLLHMVVVASLFIICLQCGLNRTQAVLASLLFGIHPMHVESVAWVSERKEVLYSCFYLLSIISYLKYLDLSKKRFYCFSILLGFCSILSKSMALSLPLILFVFDWLKGRKMTRKVIYEKLPYFAYIIPVAFITYNLNKDFLERSKYFKYEIIDNK